MKKLLSHISSFFNRGDIRTIAVKKNIIFSLGLKLLSIIITFFMLPITIGYVSSELYGIWLSLAAILAWFQFLDIGLSSGMKNKLTEAIAKRHFKRAKILVSTTYFGMIIIFLPIAVIGYFLVPYISWTQLLNVDPHFQEEIVCTMQILSVMLCLQMIVNVIVPIVASYQRVAFSQSFLVFGNSLAFILIIVSKILLPPSLPLLAIIIGGSPIFVTFLASVILFSGKYRIVSPRPRYVKPRFLKEILSLGVKFFIINVQAVIVYQSTNVLISHVSSPEVVTSYNIAYQYLSLSIFIFSNITMTLWPAYTDAYVKGDIEWMKKTRNKMNKILLLCIGMCALFALISPLVYHIWIGDRATITNTMTWFVAIYVCAYCYMNLNGIFIIGVGKVYVETIVVIIGALLYIPTSLFLSRYFNEYGVLLSLISVNFIYGLIFNYQTTKLINGTAQGIWNK